MKTSRIIAGLLATMIIATTIATAAAALVPDQLYIYGNGVTWKFAPTGENGQVVAVQPYYYLINSAVRVDISPVSTSINNNLVVLNFDPPQVHSLAGTVGTTGITVTVEGGSTYTVSGPGFTWGIH